MEYWRVFFFWITLHYVVWRIEANVCWWYTYIHAPIWINILSIFTSGFVYFLFYIFEMKRWSLLAFKLVHMPTISIEDVHLQMHWFLQHQNFKICVPRINATFPFWTPKLISCIMKFANLFPYFKKAHQFLLQVWSVLTQTGIN